MPHDQVPVPNVWWLSFADEATGANLGCCVLDNCTDIGDAAAKAWAFGCNPGGQVVGMVRPIDELAPEIREIVARIPRNRLLTVDEMQALGVRMEHLDPPPTAH